MNDKKFNISTGRGVTFWETLFLTFMVLKLTNVITWSWLVVLSPLIAEVAIVALVAVIMCMIDKRKGIDSAIFD